MQRPIVEPVAPETGSQSPFERARVSPCSTCPKNVPLEPHLAKQALAGEVVSNWPCPKQVYYYQAQQAIAEARKNPSIHLDSKYLSPIYNSSLRAHNPVWPGKHGDFGYPIVFLAFLADNLDNGWNPHWDPKLIRCRGPFLISGSERNWNANGRIRENDYCIVLRTYYHLDGSRFHGAILPGSVGKDARGYSRKIDVNVGRTVHG